MFITKNLILNNNDTFLNILKKSFYNNNLIIDKVELIPVVEDNIPMYNSTYKYYQKRKNRKEKNN